MASKTIRHTDDEFIGRYHPIFERDGSLELLSAAPIGSDPLCIWTMLDCDGSIVIASGVHFVNRMGYVVTAVPIEPGVEVEVGWDIRAEDDEGEDDEGDDDLALANFLFEDSEWKDAVASDDTRLGRDDWKLHKLTERLEQRE